MEIHSLGKRNIFKEQVTGFKSMQPQDSPLKLLNFRVKIFYAVLLYELFNNCVVTEVFGNVYQLDAGFTFEGQSLEPESLFSSVMRF